MKLFSFLSFPESVFQLSLPFFFSCRMAASAFSFCGLLLLAVSPFYAVFRTVQILSLSLCVLWESYTFPASKKAVRNVRTASGQQAEMSHLTLLSIAYFLFFLFLRAEKVPAEPSRAARAKPMDVAAAVAGFLEVLEGLLSFLSD